MAPRPGAVLGQHLPSGQRRPHRPPDRPRGSRRGRAAVSTPARLARHAPYAGRALPRPLRLSWLLLAGAEKADPASVTTLKLPHHRAGPNVTSVAYPALEVPSLTD